MRVVVLALIALVDVFSWIYGIYCGIRMYWHLKPNLPHYSTIPTDDQLTPTGQKYLRRWLWSWAAGIVTSIIGAAL